MAFLFSACSGRTFAVTALSAALLVTALPGCGWSPRGRMTALRSANSRLAEESRAQLVEIENIKAHARRVEDQLIETEHELARLDSGAARRLASAHRGSVAPLPAGFKNRLPAGVSDRLAALAGRHPSLQYDPHTGISKLDVDVLFRSGSSQLTRDAERLLDEFAGILQTRHAEELKLMVVGHTDDRRIRNPETRNQYPNNWHLSAGRALSVSDRFRAAGINGERMGVAGFGPYQPIASNDDTTSRQRNRRVEIFVMSPDVPIVGMTDTLGRLYK